MIELIDREQVLQTFDQYCERCDQPYRSDRYWECKHCRFRDARSIIRSCPAGVSMSQWIPVTERLPEVGDTYIVTIEYKGMFEGVDAADFVFTGDGYIDGKWNTWNDWVEDLATFYHVTAWMPLPDAYEGVKE